MCQLCNINVEKAEAFAGTMLQTFNQANLSVLISLAIASNFSIKWQQSGLLPTRK